MRKIRFINIAFTRILCTWLATKISTLCVSLKVQGTRRMEHFVRVSVNWLVLLLEWLRWYTLRVPSTGALFARIFNIIQVGSFYDDTGFSDIPVVMTLDWSSRKKSFICIVWNNSCRLLWRLFYNDCTDRKYILSL